MGTRLWRLSPSVRVGEIFPALLQKRDEDKITIIRLELFRALHSRKIESYSVIFKPKAHKSKRELGEHKTNRNLTGRRRSFPKLWRSQLTET